MTILASAVAPNYLLREAFSKQFPVAYPAPGNVRPLFVAMFGASHNTSLVFDGGKTCNLVLYSEGHPYETVSS